MKNVLESQNVAIIGAGTMGRSIAEGLVRSHTVATGNIVVADKKYETASELSNRLSIRAAERNAEACRDAEVIILCVKPHEVSTVLHDLSDRKALWPRATVISIAAGVTIAQIEGWIETRMPVIRAMPNTACRIGCGMTVISKGSHADDSHLETASTIFSTLGKCIALEEIHMNVVTSLSASGPAFMYVMMESLADGGVMCGLPRSVASELVAQMTSGAAAMMLTSDQHPSALKDDVTTPGGCTIAGLLALEDGKIRSVIARAVERTAQVAAGLGGPSL